MIDSTNPRIMAGNIQKLVSMSGGGTEVVANPEGAATTALTKLEVGETIYSIPQPETPLYLTKLVTDNGGSYTNTIDPDLPTGATILSIRGSATRTDNSALYPIPYINIDQLNYSLTVEINSSGEIIVKTGANRYSVSDIKLIVEYIVPAASNTVSNTRKKK